MQEYQPDIIGFQEVFSIESLKNLVKPQGYNHFAVIDQPEVIDDFIYRSPVVAIASRYPIVEAFSVQPDAALAQSLGLSTNFTFSRKVLRATIDAPHIGLCDCYAVHFKSKRSMFDLDEQNKNWSAEKKIIESLKTQVAGSWGSTIQRGSEATLLMMEMITRREVTSNPMVLMGDFNNELKDGVLIQLLTNSLRFVSKLDSNAYLEKYCLNDAWDLFQKVLANDTGLTGDSKKANDVVEGSQTAQVTEEVKEQRAVRTPTHYFSGSGSVLDYILLSCEFDASYHDSLYQLSDYHVYDRHLINPIFDRDGESTDHGVVLITLTLRT